MKSMRVLARGASKTLGAAAAFGLLATGCSSQAPMEGSSGGQFKVAVAPLQLDGVDDATYDIVVTAGVETVWERTGISSSAFGNSAGDITYVGTCTAGELNEVTLTMQTLSANGAPLPADKWVQPGPVTITKMCVENEDVLVEFNLTVMRDAEQGFFDIAVNFEDIFCSAKFDCTAGDFLHNGTDGRDDTLILGFACTAGQTRDGEPQKTTVYMSQVTIECDDDGDGEYETGYAINQSAGPGNLGNGGIDGVFQTATYRGSEELPGYDKCYWNTAIGIEIDAEDATRFDDKNCRVRAAGTAASVAFDNGTSPDDTVYPYIQWDVPLTDAAGAFICDAEHQLNAGVEVSTSYTGMQGKKFAYAMSCAEGEVETNGVTECAGSLAGVDGVSFTDDGAGNIVVAVAPTGGGDSVVNALPYQLPAGFSLAGCCVDPCCDDSGDVQAE